MATPNNENSNLMDEFEEAFQSCLLSLTKHEANIGTNKEEIELEVQKTTNRFIDVARQMEAFFLQKRFLVSTLKPDMLIKDENQDLRTEIARKEALLNKHYNRLEEWKACLADLHLQQLQNPRGGQMGPEIPPNIVGGGIAMGNRMGGLMQNLPPGTPQQQQQQQHLQLQQMRMMGKFPK